MNYEVEKAKKELYELLDKNPELRAYQNTLSNAMDSALEQDRLSVLATFMQYNLSDLLCEMIELKGLIDETIY